MNFNCIFYIGFRHLIKNKVKFFVLLIAFILIGFLPISIFVFTKEIKKKVYIRSKETPFILGRQGSSLDLVLNSLYFKKSNIKSFPVKEVDNLKSTHLSDVIALYIKFNVQKFPIIGTTIDYFSFRKLKFKKGRHFLRLGECVVGSRVAKEKGIKVGSFIISSPINVFDLGGVYPLKMKVCGVLEASDSPDDVAIFTDLKTTWIIEGLGHGHKKADLLDDKFIFKNNDSEEIKVNASITEYQEISKENISSFHFHGNISDYPINSIIVLPYNKKSQVIIKGKYDSSKTLQIISTNDQIDSLFDTIFSVQGLIFILLMPLLIILISICAIVISFSIKLRGNEFNHLEELGVLKSTIKSLILFEVIITLLSSLILGFIILLILKTSLPFLTMKLSYIKEIILDKIL